ncbi:MAG TPA: exosortase H-associated membrane protein [Casimicrobiaceae bacterium]|nr:exosortase H-associated membrane protein [Casimicrobiaceae bacterium]
MKNPLPRFVLVTLAWLPAAFAIWYLAAPMLMWPAQIAAEAVLQTAFADLVRAISAQGAVFSVLTTLKPGHAVSGGAVSVDVNMLLYSFGLPMYAALVVAAREPAWLKRLAIGYVVLLPVVAFGVVADFLKNVAITAGPSVASQTGFSAVQREAIVFAFQLASLILPTVVPAAVWVLTHRRFLERLRSESRAR